MVMGTLGKDRFGLGPLCPVTDRRKAGEITADTLNLAKWIWGQERCCCVTALETNSAYSSSVAQTRVP